MKLIIVESPAKCKKIESYLGKEYKCIASFGHFRELNKKKGLKCIDIERDFTPLFQLCRNKSKQIQKMREMIASATEVILATDDDREGEAIAWHICKTFKLPLTTRRIIFHEITKPAILKAISSPTIINMKKVESQLCRQITDLLLGFSLTPILWKYISHNSGSNKDNPLSAGRCQTPALRLVYDRENEYENQELKKEFNVIAKFDTETFVGNGEKIYKLSSSFSSKEDVLEFLSREKTHNHIFHIKPSKTIIKSQPKPFTTSTLQQAASNECSYSPKKTMTIAQKLYESGYITYMRTDTSLYSDEFIQKSIDYIKEKYGESNIRPDILSISLDNLNTKNKNNKKSNKNDTQQNAHEAIRPTRLDFSPQQLKNNSKIDNSCYVLYKLIWRNTIQSLMNVCKMKHCITFITSNHEKYTYNYPISKYIDPGWHIVNENYGEKKTQLENEYNSTISLDNTPIGYNNISSSLNVSQTKHHYTEASLIKTLEKSGIGRPSTFSSIIDKIQERGYVLKTNTPGFEYETTIISLDKDIPEIKTSRETKIFGAENNKLVLQEIGKNVIDLFMQYSQTKQLFDYNFTSDMERNLDEIEHSNMKRVDLCQTYYDLIQNAVKTIHAIENEKCKNIVLTDKYGNDYIYMKARYGPILRPTTGDKRKVFPLKPSISLEELQETNTKWDIQDIIKQKEYRDLGYYREKQLIIKKGKYGWYMTYGDVNISLNDVCKKHCSIQQIMNMDTQIFYSIVDSNFDSLFKNADVNGEKKNKIVGCPSMLRYLTPDLSIRKGKYGPYIFYKTTTMNRPKFLNCKKYNGDILLDDINVVIEWIRTTHM